MGAANFVAIEARAILENVAVIRYAVAAVASQLPFTIPEIEEIKVAVSEAVTNAVVHAYPGEPGVVRVRVEVDDRELTVTVEDDGVGIEDVARARRHGWSSDPERLGMGFYFMEEFMDVVEVSSAPGQGTRVTLRRRPEQVAPSAAEPSATVN
ncbi:MAG: anti-sigma F factor [Thermaerobacter sp.]|nr:anti-sigma F factor [Bacillota bacterium]REJ35226.1 MAG: anti-sigma F factor [Bacillota bacterium]